MVLTLPITPDKPGWFDTLGEGRTEVEGGGRQFTGKDQSQVFSLKNKTEFLVFYFKSKIGFGVSPLLSGKTKNICSTNISYKT